MSVTKEMAEQQGFDELFQVLNKISPMSTGEWNDIRPLFKLQQFKKQEYFLRTGEVANQHAFVASGLMRLFYHNSEGKEVNRGFALNGHFCGCLQSGYGATQSASFSIQALEPSNLLICNSNLTFEIQKGCV